MPVEVWRQTKCQVLGSEVVPSDSAYAPDEEDEIPRATLIWRAVKLPIYSVALIPLTVGSASAYLQTGIFAARRYFLLLASSVLIITWLNLSNDVYDFDTGADKNKKESVVNLVGSSSVPSPYQWEIGLSVLLKRTMRHIWSPAWTRLLSMIEQSISFADGK
ncbi:hypothetical protein CRG98_016242 [Punica granatum]|uniref:Uncharacterized protein n=1 Tax=Punica granatum TaxID=22663 RepID=A0A2I0K481_PUNGR|nr:hypothetical protein CRG98_016242 [Punica granatum]